MRRRDLAAILIGNLRADVDRQLLVVGVVARRDANGAFRFEESVLGGRGVIGALDDHVGCGKALLP